jgi:molybdopterin converting factor small subunit
MQITIRYSAQARAAVGKASEILELESPVAIKDLLVRLGKQYPALTRLVLTEQGQPHASLLVFVGEEQVEPTGTRALKAGEVLCILPPIAGG